MSTGKKKNGWTARLLISNDGCGGAFTLISGTRPFLATKAQRVLEWRNAKAKLPV